MLMFNIENTSKLIKFLFASFSDKTLRHLDTILNITEKHFCFIQLKREQIKVVKQDTFVKLREQLHILMAQSPIVL